MLQWRPQALISVWAGVSVFQVIAEPSSYGDTDARMCGCCCLALPAGLSSAVVFLVHPSSEPSPNKLNLLVPALAAGVHCLIAINGPGRVEGLTAPAAGTLGAKGSGNKPVLHPYCMCVFV